MLEMALPAVRQVTEFSCGAATLTSIARYHDKLACECRIMVLAGTNEKDGTSPGGLVRAASLYRIRPEVWEEASLDAVCDAVRSHRPVMVALQAWSADAKRREYYRDHWESGHWVALTAVGSKRMIFMDPALHGARASLSKTDFLRRWHDEEINGPVKQLALVFPATAEPRLQHVGRIQRMG